MPWHLLFLLSCPVSSFLTHVLVNCPSILTQALTLSSLWGALLHLIQLLWLTVITLTLDHSLTLFPFPCPRPQWHSISSSPSGSLPAETPSVVLTHLASLWQPRTSAQNPPSQVSLAPSTGLYNRFQNHSWFFPTTSNILSYKVSTQTWSWHQHSRGLLQRQSYFLGWMNTSKYSKVPSMTKR